MVKKTIIPSDIRDFLAILSIIGFVAIFFKFVLEKPFLSENMTPLFLIIGGLGVLISGKVFTINKWIKDGIQSGEFVFLFAIIFGFVSMILGVLLLTGINLSEKFTSLAGFLALAPALFIFIDYLAKNTKLKC